MGLDTKATLVVGVSMAKLFSKIEEKIGLFDEFDKYGNKTGKEFKEEKLMATLPNGKVECIAEGKSGYNNGWIYNFYDSMGFDGGEYIGDDKIVTVSIHYADYESKDLSQMIMGLTVCETDWMNSSDGVLVKKLDEIITNEAINRVRKELGDLYGYTGDIDLYLINDLSY